MCYFALKTNAHVIVSQFYCTHHFALRDTCNTDNRVNILFLGQNRAKLIVTVVSVWCHVMMIYSIASFFMHWYHFQCRGHTGEKRFQCAFPGCGKVFVIKQKLLTHKRGKHEGKFLCKMINWASCDTDCCFQQSLSGLL